MAAILSQPQYVEGLKYQQMAWKKQVMYVWLGSMDMSSNKRKLAYSINPNIVTKILMNFILFPKL